MSISSDVLAVLRGGPGAPDWMWWVYGMLLLVASGFMVWVVADAMVKGQEYRAEREFCVNAKANGIKAPKCEVTFK